MMSRSLPALADRLQRILAAWRSRSVPVEAESAWAGMATSHLQPRPRLLDPALDCHLEEHGYALVRGLLDPGDVATLARAFAANDAAVHHQPFGVSIHSDDMAYRREVDGAIRAVLEPKLDNVLNGYSLRFANFLVKTPVDLAATPSEGEVPFHQDIAAVNEAEFQSLGLWVPLVDTNEENGCLRVVPGSHLYSRCLRWAGAPFAFANESERLIRQAKPVPARAGDAIVYCQKLVHGSHPNRSAVPRIAAGALAAPRDASLIYLHQDDAAPKLLHVYAVSDSFYVSHIYQTQPRGARHIARIPARQEALDTSFAD